MQKYDTLVVGGGIAGIQSAIDLGDMGYKVLLIDKRSSIGGAMIQLSKVFPTLDCASCITTPKMSSAFHHKNIDVRTLSELLDFEEITNDEFRVKILQKARYVDMDKCTGCGECETACPVIKTDYGYDEGMGPIKAIGVPFTTALPQKAVLDMENCIFCGKCARTCPTQAINFDDRDQELEHIVKSIIIATGYKQTPTIKEAYGGGRFKNVLTGLQMERLIAPTGPYGGIFRLSDGRNPWSIAYVQCAGSRDKSIGVPYCSSICCIYAIKQAILLSAATPLADITIYYMDIRTFGKGHEEFYNEAKAIGINFIRGKVAKITEKENGDLLFRVETFDETGNVTIQENTHDMGVLSLGLVPAWNPQSTIPVALNPDGFVKKIRPKTEPSLTSIPGVFIAGTAIAPMDIMESIISASAASSKVAQWLQGELRSSYYYKELMPLIKLEVESVD